MKAWKQIGGLFIKTMISTLLLCILMYMFFACIEVETFISVAEIATNDPIETTWLFSPIVLMLCLSVMLCYIVATPPKCDCACSKKQEAPAKEEKKTKKAVAKKVAKTSKKITKK